MLPEGSTRVGSFGDSPELSEELLSLIVSGRKRAGASLLWAHEFEAEAIPRVGEIEIVVDHLNAPRLITRTTSVEVVPFSEVTAEFAAREGEGEGDGSLAYWRAAHWEFFSRECRRIGRAPSDSMPVVCASFEVLQVIRQGVMEASIEIVAYDPGWPAAFARERKLLAEILAPWVAGPIEHVGSTAVPGSPAKPVIDIMAAVESLEASRPAIGRLERAGYCHAPYREDVMHWFCKPGPGFRTHHLHLVPFASTLWRERLAFRDRLRADSRLANEYAELKRRLALEFRHDRESYTDAKGAFIRKVLAGEGSA